MGLAWLAVYYDAAGLLDGWFTIFIQVNQALAQGLSQVLFSMAVIELAKPGQEAITYELIVSVANSALTVTVVLATQLTYAEVCFLTTRPALAHGTPP